MTSEVIHHPRSDQPGPGSNQTLLNLPLVIFRMILEQMVVEALHRRSTVWGPSMRIWESPVLLRMLQLRLVCSVFDTEVQLAIFRHAQFGALPRPLSLPKDMSKDIKARLILAKMDGFPGRRLLCNTVETAVNLVARELVGATEGIRCQLTEFFAHAFAHLMDLHTICEALRPRDKELDTGDLEHLFAVYAISVNNPELTTMLQNRLSEASFPCQMSSLFGSEQIGRMIFARMKSEEPDCCGRLCALLKGDICDKAEGDEQEGSDNISDGPIKSFLRGDTLTVRDRVLLRRNDRGYPEEKNTFEGLITSAIEHGFSEKCVLELWQYRHQRLPGVRRTWDRLLKHATRHEYYRVEEAILRPYRRRIKWPKKIIRLPQHTGKVYGADC